MFLTFGTNASPQRPDSTELELEPLGRPRAKRVQVAQACDWCRVHRVKCDNSRPCQNCVARGALCGKTRSVEVRTLPQAFRCVE